MKRKFPVVLSMMLAAGLSTAPALQSNAAPHMHPYNGVEAEVNFGSSGVDIVTEADGRKVVSGIEKGDYFTVKTCDFSSGLASITITAKSEGMSVIEVRKGDASGESLGNIKLKSTDGEYQTFTANVKNLVGDNETITFVGSVGNVSIDSWSAAPLTDVETPEDPTQPENPDQPTQPGQPENPEQPENPDQPQQPENPDQPEQPENPDQPQLPENPSTTEGKDVTYTINSWGTGYLVNFKVTNNTGAAVDGWTVKIRKDQVNIDSSWCVNITEEGDYYVITPLSWNTHVENGQTIEFGLIGTGSIGDSIYVTVE